MPASLDFATYVELIDTAGAELRQYAVSAGFDAAVPTCPGWSVADLVAHQGMIHRWARANLRGEDAPYRSEAAVLDAIGTDELAQWFAEGVDTLLDALRNVPADVDAMVFLADAGTPRDFWARRQAYETTIHTVDALAAMLGRPPRAAEFALASDVALDGIDELVCGFVPRDRSSLRSDEPYTLSIAPMNTERGWLLHIADSPVVTWADRVEHADATFEGTPAQLLLGLWNRGDEIETTGRAGVFDAWRSGTRVTWGT